MKYTNVVWYQFFLWLFYSFYMPESTTLFIFVFLLLALLFCQKMKKEKYATHLFGILLFVSTDNNNKPESKQLIFETEIPLQANNLKLLEFWIIRKELEFSNNLLSTGNLRSFREQIQLTAVMPYTHYKRMKTWMNGHNSNCRLSIGTSCRIFWLTILF